MIPDRKAFTKFIEQAQEEIEKMDTFEAKARELQAAWMQCATEAEELAVIIPFLRDTHNAALGAAIDAVVMGVTDPEDSFDACENIRALKVEKPET